MCIDVLCTDRLAFVLFMNIRKIYIVLVQYRTIVNSLIVDWQMQYHMKYDGAYQVCVVIMFIVINTTSKSLAFF